MEPNRMFTAFDDAFPYTRHTQTFDVVERT